MNPVWTRAILSVLLLVMAGVGFGAACDGARSHASPAPDPHPRRPVGLRIYYLVDLDGYLEPCGCQSRPLGGIDRLARFLENERSRAPASIFLAAGDLLYRDPTLDPRMEFQEASKADAMVRILDQLGLAAFAPGPSDFVRGAAAWQHSVALGHAAPLAADVVGSMGTAFRRTLIRDVGGARVAIVGVSDFRESADIAPPNGSPETSDPVAAARAAVSDARREGADLVVLLASVPRRVARAIAGDVPGVNFVIAAREESNSPPPPERIGNAFLVTASNQGKGLGILDVVLRDDATHFVDASEVTASAARVRLDARIAELRTRIANWEHDATVDRAAVEQQRQRLAQLEHDRADLAAPAHPPANGSYFLARSQEISPDLPKRPDVEHTIAEYFRQVNDHNRAEYANLAPAAAVGGQAAYVGDDSCRDCHSEAYDIWMRTPHSRAYHTLEAVSKNFNLSCVGCHVTGYRQPGGSEVVQNDGLRDVQCEACHGPGSLHAAARTGALRRATIRTHVDAEFCATQCHTPEHSDHFNYATYLPRILGPGHGFPVNGHGGAVTMTSPILQGGANADASAAIPVDAAAP